MKTLTKLATVSALALAVMGPVTALAQETSAPVVVVNTTDAEAGMPAGGQLIIPAQKALDLYGIDVDASELSTAQLTEIQTLTTTDNSGDIEAELRAIVEAQPEAELLETLGPDLDDGEQAQLVDVAQDMIDTAGYDVDASTLSNEQLVEIYALQDQSLGDKSSELSVILQDS